MEVHEIRASLRDAQGSRACRKLRRQDLVPAILYGHGQPGVMLALRTDDIEEALAERALVLKVTWDGQEETAQIKHVQYDALGDELLHVDLTRISLTEKVTVTVPVTTHGTAPGVEEGGVLELVMFQLEIECLPTDIPENIRVEVGELNIGDNLTVADLAFPEGVVPVDEPDAVVVTIVPPTEEAEEEEEAPEAAVAEPEVIGREGREQEEAEEEQTE